MTAPGTNTPPPGIALTAAQQRIVEWDEGPLVVIAGAGTGRADAVRRLRGRSGADQVLALRLRADLSGESAMTVNRRCTALAFVDNVWMRARVDALVTWRSAICRLENTVRSGQRHPGLGGVAPDAG